MKTLGVFLLLAAVSGFFFLKIHDLEEELGGHVADSGEAFDGLEGRLKKQERLFEGFEEKMKALEERLNLKREKLEKEKALAPRAYRVLPEKSFIRFFCETDLHDFPGEASEFAGQALLAPRRATQKVRGQVFLQVASLKTGDEGRDKDMWEEVLLLKKYPKIIFEAERLEMEKLLKIGGRALLIGRMTINAVSRDMRIPVFIENDGGGGLLFKGKSKMKLTDFGIDPPGSFWPLRVKNKMTFSFQIHFQS
jgi:polyisoprenoid-binding protein YceI